MDNGDDLDQAIFQRAIDALRRLPDMPSGTSVETEEVRLKAALLTADVTQPEKSHGFGARMRATIHALSGRSPGAEACLAMLRKTGRFTTRELRIIRRVKMFEERELGGVTLRPQKISSWQAALWIAALCFIGGVWAGWVIGTHQTQPEQMIFGVWFGTLLGMVAGYVVENSFRFARVKEKVLAVAPWFSEAVMSS